MKRFTSLDVLRGATVVAMILVNNVRSGAPSCFGHVPWNGCTFADLVFPFFLFIVGASLWFATRKNQHTLDRKTTTHILWRGAVIFLIGVLLNWFPFTSPFETLRIPGVLQRIALVYVLAAFLCLWLKSYVKILTACLLLLLGYWALLGFTTGVDPSQLAGNIVRRVDETVFGSHIGKLQGLPFDPEGLLSTLPAVGNAMLGYVFAKFLGTRELRTAHLGGMLAIGVLMVGLALLWDKVFPMNKRLWTSSFVLYTSGWAAVSWAFLSWIIDVRGWIGWSSFFRVFGANTLLAYILSILLAKINGLWTFTLGTEKYTVYQWLDQNVFSFISWQPLHGLMWGFFLILVCWALTWPLYKKKIYIKI